ncbi:MAG: tetratricopeptide repeat protein [Myxococcales bacterium]|nr:tetratricopeptide repeat protein [Myxococcales bacterium]
MHTAHRHRLQTTALSLVSVGLLCLGTGCPAQPPPPPSTAQAGPTVAVAPAPASRPVPSPHVALPPHAPMTQQELPTTDGPIAFDNLEGSLLSLQKFAQTRPTDAVIQLRIVQLLCARAQFRGTLADYQRAAAQVEHAFRVAPKAAHSFVARARVRAVFHDFVGAEKDLAAAEKLDPELGASIAASRLSLQVAQGQDEPALAAYRELRKKAPDILTTGAEAALLADRGELAAADELFIAAQGHFRDVSPFPVAWLYFQHGLMWERAGRLSRAEELYAAAVSRLPGYAAATSHWAAVLSARGAKEQARTLLQALTQSADDPEYKAQLAALLQDQGRPEEAKPLIAEAQRRYTELLAAHRPAFLSHAARFYLGIGGQPAMAHKLAEENLKAIHTTEAQLLVIEAASAGPATARACALADVVRQKPGLSDPARIILSRAYSACGQPSHAAAILSPTAERPASPQGPVPAPLPPPT